MAILSGGKRAEGSHSREASGLSGWAGIEDTVAKDDEGKMKGYSEDIDTLLVFAGLFSAILTAFVVQTYQMLQPSSADLTNQLLATNNQILAQNNQIFVQGFSAALIGSPFSPPQLITPNDLPPFQPSTAARWINTLLFTSLVLSLAAALLGILVKQWVREYMQWNSPLATPQENVMVRQFRFEAWEAWNVSAVVSTVPALLEVAMILFLVGMIILLWTLDDVVAICLTAFTAMFLLVVAVFTVLPVFSRRCPYKLPTAWAVMAAYRVTSHSMPFWLKRIRETLIGRRWRRFIQESWTGIPVWCYVFVIPINFVLVVFIGMLDDELEQQEPVVWRQLPLSWRDVDLDGCRSMLPRFGFRQLKSGIMRTAVEGTLLAHASHRSEQKAAVDGLTVEVKETILLLQALSWVARSSQNFHVITYVEQCREEDQHPHQHALDFLLRAAAHEYRYEPLSPKPASEVRRLLLQLTLDHSKHYSTSASLHRAYVAALQDCKIAPPPADRRLVLEQGFNSVADCEMLLVNYFPSEFTHGDQDLIEMLIATATVWLDLCDIQLASRNIVVDVLEKMVRAADALSRESALAPLDSVVGVSQGGGSLEVGAGHRRWILQLDWKSETLKSRYGALYRQLLHALAKAYKLGKLRGDQNLIRECLHNMLDASHKNSEYEYTCEVDACPWTGHSNPYRHEGYHHVKCDLLAKSAKPASAAGARDRESPSGSELRLSSLSPNLAISSDPPQGLTHAAPYRTTAHELEGFLAPVIDTPGYRSLRSSLPATEHEARRHAIAMVRDARSMEQLTRPEAVQVAPGRRRSWG